MRALLLVFVGLLALGRPILAQNNTRSDTLDLLHTQLSLDFTNWSDQVMYGEATIEVRTLIDDVDKIVFDLNNFSVDSVCLNGLPAGFNHVAPLLVIAPSEPLDANETIAVQIYYHGTPQEDASGLGGFYWQENYAFNLGVGVDANPNSFGRSWHPCFDNFVERSSYQIEVLTSANRQAYCGGLPESLVELPGDSLITSWIMEEPIPSYLASIAIGDYVRVEQTYNGLLGETPLWLIARAQDTTAVKNSFTHLFDAMDGYEQFYGPYRWPKVGYVMVPFSSGAMEHATNIAYPILAANGSLTFAWIMAHELAHSWWGNLVTCHRQDEMWLNEGFATFSEALFFEHLEGYESYLDYMRSKHKDVLTTAHVRDGGRFAINNIPHQLTYGAHVYDKGASVIHSLRGIMGNTFFQALQDFLEENAFSAIHTNQLRDFLSDYTTADLVAFFQSWVNEPGYPDFRLGSTAITSDNGAFHVQLVIEQHLHHAPEYYTNVPISLTFFEGTHADNTETIEVITSGPETLIEVTLPFEPQQVIINRDERIQQAVLAEELTFSSNGIKNLAYAEFRMNVSNFSGQNEAWARAENHWSPADIGAEQPEFRISSDRFWRIRTSGNTNFNASCRVRFFGNPDASSFFDTEFFNEMDELGLPEDSIIIVYRPTPDAPWQLHPAFSVSIQNVPNDYQGFIDFDWIGPGDYAWGYHTGLVGTREISKPASVVVYPNPASDRLMVLSYTGSVRIYAANGRLVIDQPYQREGISIVGLPPGWYLLQTDDGRLQKFIKSAH